MDFGDRSLKFTLTLDLGERSLKSGLGPWIRGSILEIFPYHGFDGVILEIRLGAMDFGDRSLKFSLTLDLGDRSLKSGLGPWISGIDPCHGPKPDFKDHSPKSRV